MAARSGGWETPERPAGRPVALDLRPILLVIGILLIVLALFMAPPMVADLAARHPDWDVFLVAGAVTLFAGVGLVLMNRAPTFDDLSGRQALLLITLGPVVLALFAALPLAFSGLELSPTDAVFEAVSGITTTGSTVITGLDVAPPGILLWRAILQWLGGIGIIIMGVAILPFLGFGGALLVRPDTADLADQILPRAAQIASAIGLLYLGLTMVCAGLYWLAGMTPFEAAAHSMATIATGGYSTRDASIGAFGSGAIEWIAMMFMILGALPFLLYRQMANDMLGPLLHDAQLRWFVTIIAGSSLALLCWLLLTSDLAWPAALQTALFHTISMITGTGYLARDGGLWGTLPALLFFVLTWVGGCAGSTAGGIKIFRFAVLCSVARDRLARLIRPHGVSVPVFDRLPLSAVASVSVLGFIALFGVTLAVVALGLALLGLDAMTALCAALMALANAGPGLGEIVGGAGNAAPFPDAAKWLLSGAMLLGRLELVTVLILVTPAFWRD